MTGPDFSGKKRHIRSAGEVEESVKGHRQAAQEHCDNRNYVAAEKSLNAALSEIEGSGYPRNSPLRISVYESLVAVTRALGDLPLAEQHISVAIQTQAVILGGDYAYEKLQLLRATKADILTEQGKFSEADAVWQSIYSETTKESTRVMALLGLARLCGAEGKGAERTQWIRTAFNEIAQMAESYERFETAGILARASVLEAANARFEDAANLLEQSSQLLGDNADLSTNEVKEDISVQAAQYHDKAGNFARAQLLRVRALHSAKGRLGDEDTRVTALRSIVAQGYLEEGRFEAAESLLQQNLEYARAKKDQAHMAGATLVLAHALSERGNYVDAFALLDRLEQEISFDAHKIHISSLRLKADMCQGCGLTDTAVKILEVALERASELQGIEADIESAQIRAMIAGFVRFTDPERMNREIAAAREIVDGLPPYERRFTHEDLSAIEVLLKPADGDSDVVANEFGKELERIERMCGTSRPIRKAELLMSQASLYEQVGDIQQAIATLDSARELLESRNRTGTVLYGSILLRLADLVNDGRTEAYRSRGKAILEKMQVLEDDTSSEDSF